MKEKDVIIGMKLKLNGTGDDCVVLSEKDYRTMYGNVYTVINIKTGRKKTLNACDFEPYIDTQEIADALNKAFNNLAETLTKTLQPLIDALSRPDVAKALDALGKDKGNLMEEISKAFEEFRVSGTPYSSFTIFEAGYHAGMKRGDKWTKEKNIGCSGEFGVCDCGGKL